MTGSPLIQGHQFGKALPKFLVRALMPRDRFQDTALITSRGNTTAPPVYAISSFLSTRAARPPSPERTNHSDALSFAVVAHFAWTSAVC